MPITPASITTDPYTFINNGLLTLTRASVPTRVKSTGLIETVPVITARLDHDPGTLAQKGLLLEESRTNILTQSNTLTNAMWEKARATITNSTDFPIFSSGGVVLLTADGQNDTKAIYRVIPTSSTTRTFSVYLHRGTGNFAQALTAGDNNIFVNFNLLTGVTGDLEGRESSQLR
jgi:hypothetical protein